MTNVKCIRCGVVNPVSNEVCKVCGAELRPAPPFTHDTSPQSEPTPSGPPPVAGIHPFDGVGDVLGPTFSLFFKNLWLITKIVVVIAAPFELFQALSLPQQLHNDWQLSFGTFLLQIVSKILIAPALIYALMQVLQTGVAPGVNESYRWGLSKIVKLGLCGALAWLLQGLGFALLIIPGIILMLAFTVVYPVAVLEKRSIVETVKRSYHLTKGYKLSILGAVILLGIVFGVISIPVSVLPNLLLFNTDTIIREGLGTQFLLAHAFAALIVDILDQATTVFSLVVYLSILRTLE
jgi:hypothetical protein